jgi:hypothetical protein
MTIGKWNYVAICGLLVLVFVNWVATVALFSDLITWEQWLATAGWVNGPPLGWVSKSIGQEPRSD